MLERFTEKACKVDKLAQEEARRLGHNFVGTEQLLLGLIGEGTGIAAKTLKSLGVNLKDARVEVEKIIGRGSGFVAAEIPYTPRGKRVIEFAWDEARQLGHNYIGTEHLLLGIVRQGEGVALRVLENLGVDLTKVRLRLIRLLAEPGANVESSPATSAQNVRLSGDPRPASQANYGGLAWLVDIFGTDLTASTDSQSQDPVAGRQSEIEQVLCILGRDSKANPLLIGEKGVGKSAIVRGVAARFAEYSVQDSLQGLRLVSLDIQNIIAHHDSAKILKDSLQAAKDNKIILVIDNLHVLMSPLFAGSVVMDAALSLNWFLKHNKVKCIGMATLSNIGQHYSKPAAILANFRPIIVSPCCVDLALDILRALKVKLELHHQVNISEQAISKAAALSDTISNRHLPEKAVRVLDEACALVKLRPAKPDARKLVDIQRDMKARLSAVDISKDESFVKLEKELEEGAERITVTANDVEEVVRCWNQNLRTTNKAEG